MVKRTRHIIMNIRTLIYLLKFCLHIVYMKKVIVMYFRQYMYISFVAIKNIRTL